MGWLLVSWQKGWPWARSPCWSELTMEVWKEKQVHSEDCYIPLWKMPWKINHRFPEYRDSHEDPGNLSMDLLQRCCFLWGMRLLRQHGSCTSPREVSFPSTELSPGERTAPGVALGLLHGLL